MRRTSILRLGLVIGLLGSSLLPGCGPRSSSRPSSSSSPLASNGQSAPVAKRSGDGEATADRTRVLREPRWTDIDGRPVEFLPLEAKALLLFFSRQDCPIANAYAPRIERIYKKYQSRGIHSVLVQTDSSATLETLQQHAHEYRYTLPVVHDRSHALVDGLQATLTPQAALIDREGNTLYLGRIDDQYVALGKKRRQAEHHDLEVAIDAFLAGAPIAQPRTPGVGCVIERPSR